MANEKVSPKDVGNVLGNNREQRYRRDIERARNEGFHEGVNKGRRELIDWLEAQYMQPNAPDRGSPEAKAILKLAQEASLHFKSKFHR